MLNEEKIKPSLGDGEEWYSDMWYLNTSTSNHMIGCKDTFADLDSSVKGLVRFGDGFVGDIQGHSTILFQTKTNEHKVLTDIYYIPRLRGNVVGLGQLDEHDCKIVLEDGYLCIFDRQEQLVVRVRRSHNHLYVLRLNLMQPVCLLAKYTEKEWMWHARYGHLNVHALKSLSHMGMVDGMPNIAHTEQLCEACLVGKQHRSPFPLASTY